MSELMCPWGMREIRIEGCRGLCMSTVRGVSVYGEK